LNCSAKFFHLFTFLFQENSAVYNLFLQKNLKTKTPSEKSKDIFFGDLLNIKFYKIIQRE